MKQTVLLIDNYDSFTFNLFQVIEELGATCVVARNDKIDLVGIQKLKPSHIILSPGPGNPDDAGITLAVIKKFAGHIPIFGVCLGHQAIGQAFGGEIVRASKAKHGKLSRVTHDGSGVYQGLPQGFIATRYHSLIVREESLPSCLEISARSEDGLIMGLRHKKFKIEGVQFHPESIATTSGRELLSNMLGRSQSKMKARAHG